MKTLITGANGFVARSLFQLIADKEEQITRVDVGGAPDEGIISCDLSSIGETQAILERFRPQRIYNLVGSFSNDYAIDWKANYLVTKNILDAVLEVGLAARVLLLGSAAEYGVINKGDNPVSELHPLRPASVYGFTKAMQTLLMNFYCSTKGMDLLMARPFNLYGRGISRKLFIGNVYSQLDMVMKGQAQTVVVGNLDARRDYIDIESAVRCLRLIIEKGNPGEVYNVGKGYSIRTYDLLESILNEYGLDMNIVRTGAGNRTSEYDASDVFADITKINALRDSPEDSVALTKPVPLS